MSLKLSPSSKEYLEINFLEDPLDENVFPEENKVFKNLPFADSDIYTSSLKAAAYLTHGTDVKTVISICLDIQDLEIRYEPGDTFGILPQNNEDEINKLIERLNYTFFADKKYVLQIKETEGKKNIPPHIPTVYSLRRLLLNCLDIRSIPKKGFLRALSKYTSNENEMIALNDICSLRYSSFLAEQNYTLLDILEQFPSCFPPVTVLLEHLPRLQPRPYSVANSPFSENPHYSELKFVFSVSYIPNSLEGVATGWLNRKVKYFLRNADEHIESQDIFKVRLYRRKTNKFKLPEQIESNIIMICAGTGIAPFIGFLEHLEIKKKNMELLSSIRVSLFYGCRYSDRDFLFKSKLDYFHKTGVLNEFIVSFSRENTGAKYVQDNIKETANEFVSMLENSKVYVCGSAKMCKDVLETITHCLCNTRSISKTEATGFMNNLKKEHNYIEDIWT